MEMAVTLYQAYNGLVDTRIVDEQLANKIK